VGICRSVDRARVGRARRESDSRPSSRSRRPDETRSDSNSFPLDWGMPTIRALARRPGFSLGVIAMFAIGIAASTAIFSIFNGLFLCSLPFPAADRLVHLSEAVAQPEHEADRDLLPSRRGVANPFRGVRSCRRLFRWRRIQFLRARQVFSRPRLQRHLRPGTTLGIKPILEGTLFRVTTAPARPNTVLLGYGLWQHEFAGRADVVGKLIQIDSAPYTVIGVLPSEAVFPAANDFWIPRATFMPDQARVLNGVARLKSGVTLRQGRADLIRVNAIVKLANSVDFDPLVVSLRDRYLGDYRAVTQTLLGAVGVILLIACANIAAWMTARGTSRNRELAIRAAIGATRGTLIRQLLAESFCLASIGGLAGIGPRMGRTAQHARIDAGRTSHLGRIQLGCAIHGVRAVSDGGCCSDLRARSCIAIVTRRCARISLWCEVVIVTTPITRHERSGCRGDRAYRHRPVGSRLGPHRISQSDERRSRIPDAQCRDVSDSISMLSTSRIRRLSFIAT